MVPGGWQSRHSHIVIVCEETQPGVPVMWPVSEVPSVSGSEEVHVQCVSESLMSSAHVSTSDK